MNEKRMRTWEQKRQQGRAPFVFRSALLNWGIITVTLYALSDWSKMQWLVFSMIFLPLSGLLGLYIWHITEAQYRLAQNKS